MKKNGVFFRLLYLANAVAIATALSFFSLPASAHELYEMHINPREMGLGGSFISIVNNEESLWYNPAGIARDTGVHWTIANPRVGASDPTVMQNLTKLQSQSSFQTTLNSLYGKPMWANAGADSAVIMPHFAFGYYLDGDASLLITNPVDPTMDLNYVFDKGFAAGTGWSFGNMVDMGFVTKYIMRTGVRETFGSDTIGNIINGGSTSTIFNNLNNQGTGISLDWGTNIRFGGPVNPVFSFVWKDIGDTSFLQSSTSAAAPPTDYSDMEVGGSFTFKLPLVHIMPVFEIRDLTDSTVQMTSKVHAGVEVDLPMIDLRAGLDQGYFSYGCGFDLGLLRISAASWGEEIGGAPGQMKSQRYLVELTLRLGFDSFGSAHISPDASQGAESFDDFDSAPFVRR